jgi:hypothetical protein
MSTTTAITDCIIAQIPSGHRVEQLSDVADGVNKSLEVARANGLLG